MTTIISKTTVPGIDRFRRHDVYIIFPTCCTWTGGKNTSSRPTTTPRAVGIIIIIIIIELFEWGDFFQQQARRGRRTPRPAHRMKMKIIILYCTEFK